MMLSYFKILTAVAVSLWYMYLHRYFKWYTAAIHSMIFILWWWYVEPHQAASAEKNGEKLPCEFYNQSNRTSGLLSLLATIARSLQLLRDPIKRQVVGNTKKEVQLERCSKCGNVLKGLVIYSCEAQLFIHWKYLWFSHILGTAYRKSESKKNEDNPLYDPSLRGVIINLGQSMHLRLR